MTEIETDRPAYDATGWVGRHPIRAFLLLALPLALAVMTVPVLAEYDVIPGDSLPGYVGIDMEEATSLLMLVVIFSATLLVTLASEGRNGVRVLLRRMTRLRVGLPWWLFAAAGMPLGTVVLAVLFGDEASMPSASTLAGEAASLLFAVAVINMMEEGTWTGFLQTRLERRMNLFLAAAVVTVPFAVVHLPLRIITHEATNASELFGAFVAVLILGVFIRTLLASIVRGAANSVLLAAVTHTMFNRSNNVDGLAADVLTGPNRQSAALLTLVLLTVIVLIATRRQLGRAYRLELDEAEGRALDGAR